MSTETIRTTLRFTGDWPWWAGVGGAVLLAILAFVLYRPDVRAGRPALRWILPALRALAVAMIVLMLSGPVLHHRKVVGQLSRLLLFIDGSRSMGLTDSSMELGRKLHIMQTLGLLPESAVKMDLPRAGEALEEAQLLAQKASASQNLSSPEWAKVLADFAAGMERARQGLADGGAADRLETFGRELLEPAKEIAHREMKQIDDRRRAAQDLTKLAETSARWQSETATRFRNQVMEGAGLSSGSPVGAALLRFDSMPRWQRMQMALLEGEKGRLLARLAEKHEVQVFALDEGASRKLWDSAAGRLESFPALGKPTGEATDLAEPLTGAIGNDLAADEHAALVLLSDGQHNEGASPLETAKVLGGRELPIYTVGFGANGRPHDLAVLKVQAPESIYAEDRVRGQITLKDDMPPGLPFTVSIKDGERVLWQEQLATQGNNQRTVPFDFTVSESVQERTKKEQHGGVQVAGLPLQLRVAVSSVAGDSEPGNNALDLRLRALTQKRKILLLDGRPRWETRYLRNLFERDEQWEINTVIGNTATGVAGLARGKDPGQFPSDPSLLAGYDLIIFGEVPVGEWQPGELQSMRDFVEKRGGAIIFIDGQRRWFKDYGETPLGPLFPVAWTGNELRAPLGHLALAERAPTLAPFALASERPRSLEIWHNLPSPHWLAGVSALPGSETLVSVETPSGPAPLVVLRPFGAGRVLYHADDETWRWRYEVADLYHAKYWSQLADWIAELPFAVHDKFVSLDAGAITYRPGETAELRVRLRDGDGRPVTDAVADAILYRDGLKVAAIRLAPDENAGGLFHGRTAQLEPGDYEVAVESAAISSRDALARTSFKVEPRETGELAQLGLNEDLLRQMSSASGGQYLREEESGRLVDLLAPLSHGEVIESETVLWQSPWWFALLILAFTLEWLLRKRAGML